MAQPVADLLRCRRGGRMADDGGGPGAVLPQGMPSTPTLRGGRPGTAAPATSC